MFLRQLRVAREKRRPRGMRAQHWMLPGDPQRVAEQDQRLRWVGRRRRQQKACDRGDQLDILRRNISRPLSSRAHKEMFVQASLAMESRTDHRGPGKAAWSARIEE